jgi:serine protease
VSTLVTPDMWHLIGITAPVDISQGRHAHRGGPLTWPNAEIPSTGHYCFVRFTDHPQDPAPPQPPSTAEINCDAFRDFIRNHNNVTWRNFNVVADLPQSGGDPVVLPFLIAGTTDRAREFDLEVIRRLPAGAEPWLELGKAVAGQILKRAQWKGEVDHRRTGDLLRLPAVPRLPLCGIRLGKSARHQARLLVHGARNIDFRGNEAANRQVFRQAGDEPRPRVLAFRSPVSSTNFTWTRPLLQPSC